MNNTTTSGSDELTLSEAFDIAVSQSEMHFQRLLSIGNVYNLHIRDFIGSKRLHQITTDDMIIVCTKLSYLGWDITFIEDMMQILSSCLSHDDFFDVKSYDPAKDAINRIRGIEDRMLSSTDEQGLENFEKAKEKILAFADRNNSPLWRAFFTVAFGTGLSYRHLCALTWGDIDLVEKKITATHTMIYNGGRYTRQKDGHMAVIPMRDRMYEEIIRYRYEVYHGKLEELYPEDELNDMFVFVTKKGRQLHDNNISTQINWTIGEINLREYVDAYLEGRTPRLLSTFRLKDIRAGFIIRMHELGYNDYKISAMLPGRDVAYVSEIVKRLEKTKQSQMFRYQDT